MLKIDLIKEIVRTYERHGWSLRRVLLRTDSSRELSSVLHDVFADAELREADFDALWFARPSHKKREAWELRLLAEQPYALFEAFEAEETDEEREEALREMENRMREYANR